MTREACENLVQEITLPFPRAFFLFFSSFPSLDTHSVGLSLLIAMLALFASSVFVDSAILLLTATDHNMIASHLQRHLQFRYLRVTGKEVASGSQGHLILINNQM
jgi:hypothetical protein